MRNHLEILADIDSLLITNGFNNERQVLKDEISASSTGGELFSRCGSKLLTLQNTNKDVDSLIGNLIKEFILYCNKNGLEPQINYEH